MMRMVVTALAGAGTVLAAAGALRAVLIVVAEIRELAPALVAPGALRAIPVVAALSANGMLRIPVLTANEPVAAVELRAAISGRHFQETAGFVGAAAAVTEIDALALTALFALRACAIAGAFGAVRAGAAVGVSAACLAFTFDAVLGTALIIGAAAARHLAVAVVAIRAVLVARRAAMTVYAVQTFGALTGAGVVAARLAGTAGEVDAQAALALLAIATIGIAAAAASDSCARIPDALEAAIAAVFAAGATATGHWGVARIGCCAVFLARRNTRTAIANLANAAIAVYFAFRCSVANTCNADVGAALAIAITASPRSAAVLTFKASRGANIYFALRAPDIDALFPHLASLRADAFRPQC
jgi:hypothetical protein